MMQSNERCKPDTDDRLELCWLNQKDDRASLWMITDAFSKLPPGADTAHTHLQSIDS